MPRMWDVQTKSLCKLKKSVEGKGECFNESPDEEEQNNKKGYIERAE